MARLDSHLVGVGAFPSRARAQGAIKAGLVAVDGRIERRPAAVVTGMAAIVVTGDLHDFVSRGGVKLEAALRAFAIEPAGLVCLDLGASTGGFTEALLRAGAERVYAVDVGHGQLHAKIAADSRVIILERTHAKDLSKALIPDPIDLVVCDVSFISLKQALPPALALAAPGARLVALIKPQFEVGRQRLGKGGIVKPEDAARVAEEMRAWIERIGWRALGLIESPIAGGDGNREYLLAAAGQG
jgi:23S rRNA (cytidine1920-2'-O)/16S rRNA (cytidine1409-2'-O)-methyltransferase